MCLGLFYGCAFISFEIFVHIRVCICCFVCAIICPSAFRVRSVHMLYVSGGGGGDGGLSVFICVYHYAC